MTEKKKIFSSVLMAVLGVIILGAYFNKWVPFSEELTENYIKFAMTTVWGHCGWLLGFLFMAPFLSVIVEEFHIAEKLFH